jgi:hypothetical protein
LLLDWNAFLVSDKLFNFFDTICRVDIQRNRFSSYGKSLFFQIRPDYTLSCRID